MVRLVKFLSAERDEPVVPIVGVVRAKPLVKACPGLSLTTCLKAVRPAPLDEGVPSPGMCRHAIKVALRVLRSSRGRALAGLGVTVQAPLKAF